MKYKHSSRERFFMLGYISLVMISLVMSHLLCDVSIAASVTI